jgi:hypothetical protein
MIPDPGLKETTSGRDMTNYYQEGDYIVPRYHDLGHKLKEGKVYGDREEIMRKAEAIAANAMRQGAELLPVPAKVTKNIAKTAPKKNVKTMTPTLKVDGFNPDMTPVTPTPPPQYSQVANADDALPTLDIVFKNAFGKIKVTVIKAQIDDRSICLFFKDETEVRFEPEVGDKFTIIVGADAYEVFYPGFLFTWLDGRKKIMVLGRELGEKNEN